MAHKTAAGFEEEEPEPRVLAMSSPPVLATSRSIDIPVIKVIRGDAKMI